LRAGDQKNWESGRREWLLSFNDYCYQ